MAIHRLEPSNCSTNVGQCMFYLALDRTISQLVNICHVKFDFDLTLVLIKLDRLAKILQLSEKKKHINLNNTYT